MQDELTCERTVTGISEQEANLVTDTSAAILWLVKANVLPFVLGRGE